MLDFFKNLSVGICDGAQSTVHSSLSFSFPIFFRFSFLLLCLSFSVVMSLLDYFFFHFSFVSGLNGLVFMF